MTVRNLQHLFRPQSIAVIGASPRAQSVGAIVMRNLVSGGCAGPIMPVNPKYHAIDGKRCYASMADLPATPDLGVICTPPATVPGLIAALGACGTKAAVVLTAGLNAHGEDGRSLAFIAVPEGDKPQTLGVVRAITDPDRTRAEFAILVRSDLKGKGIGGALRKRSGPVTRPTRRSHYRSRMTSRCSSCSYRGSNRFVPGSVSTFCSRTMCLT